MCISNFTYQISDIFSYGTFSRVGNGHIIHKSTQYFFVQESTMIVLAKIRYDSSLEHTSFGCNEHILIEIHICHRSNQLQLIAIDNK